MRQTSALTKRNTHNETDTHIDRETHTLSLVASQHVGSFLIRAQTCIPYIKRQILNHWTNREVRMGFFLKMNYLIFMFYEIRKV